LKRISVIGLCLIFLMPAGCARPQTQRYQAEFLSLFDTVTTIVGYSDSEEHFKALAEEIRAELEAYHQLYDIYHAYPGLNNIKTINDNAGIKPVVVDGRIIDMLEFAKEACGRSGGAFNVALGPVLRLWHDYREAGLDDPENAQLPPAELLQEAALHTDINDVIIDREASTVYLRDAGMRLDVGAIAKGYAIEQVARDAESRGVASLLISVGGNVRAIGKKLDADSSGDRRWAIGIQNPDKSSPRDELMLVQINGLSVVSSGIYERYYTVDGRQYHHIIDPGTLMPAGRYAQVSIICRDSGLADALSTAVFCMPLDKGKAFIEQTAGVEAAWVLENGGIEYSSGFESYIKAD